MEGTAKSKYYTVGLYPDFPSIYSYMCSTEILQSQKESVKRKYCWEIQKM
jgi:hypothetical protein